MKKWTKCWERHSRDGQESQSEMLHQAVPCVEIDRRLEAGHSPFMLRQMLPSSASRWLLPCQCWGLIKKRDVKFLISFKDAYFHTPTPPNISTLTSRPQDLGIVVD